MTSIKYDCPRCRSKGAAFRLVDDVISVRDDIYWYSTATCGVCSRPSLFEVRMARRGIAPSSSPLDEIEDVVRCHPNTPEASIPDSIPDNVARPYFEAEQSFAAGHFSAAGSCYRKAMERSLKHLNPDLKGMLNARIRQLEKSGLLPEGLVELLDHVRLFGNTAMHEDDFDPTEGDCALAREFSQLFLTYAFSLPAKVAATKATVDQE